MTSKQFYALDEMSRQKQLGKVCQYFFSALENMLATKTLYKVQRMKKLILISIFLLLTLLISKSGFSQTQKPHYFAPFQGKKVFCSTDHDEKAFVTIKGNQLNIIIGNKK